MSSTSSDPGPGTFKLIQSEYSRQSFNVVFVAVVVFVDVVIVDLVGGFVVGETLVIGEVLSGGVLALIASGIFVGKVVA